MAKNDVQLLQEIVDKLGGQMASDLSATSANAAASADLLSAVNQVVGDANLTLSQQLIQLLPARTGNSYSVASIAASAAAPDLLLIPANALRKGATIYNDSTAILYLLNGDRPATSSNYTVQVGANNYYEVPFTYAGPVRGVWASANGNARVTEYTN